MISAIGIFAMQYLATPYHWGGKTISTGFDCSGLVTQVLKDTGFMKEELDLNSKSLYSWATNQTGFQLINYNCQDCLLFFGESIDKINHVAISINNDLMIEAHGDETIKSNKVALEKGAMVKVSKISKRKDLIAVVRMGAMKHE